ncbi:MAG: hypothetical protein ACQCN3_15470 [Candidatus Bathyarchaeia archaeon]
MSNEMKTFTCLKCGWTIKTPFGDQDNEDHIKLHNAKHHDASNMVARAKISKQELIRLQ